MIYEISLIIFIVLFHSFIWSTYLLLPMYIIYHFHRLGAFSVIILLFEILK